MAIERADLALKVLTVNAHKGFTIFNRKFMLHELRDAIRATEADVVFLQEVLGAHERHASRQTRWPSTSQYEFLADSIWSDFAYGRNAVYSHGHHGNALLSKYPIVSYENVDVSVDKFEKRGLLHSVLRPLGLGQDVHTICVHLGLRARQRRAQLEALCRWIANEIPADSPLIVAGDFNDWNLHGQRFLSRSSELKEVFNESRGRVARSFPARFPVLRLDRIYVRNVAEYAPVVLKASRWGLLSDHAPLAARISL
ncbi:endonuclease/exonuclease/phosphatase family protein [Eoetvoesiella caeni]|uniref:Endonuclease/exonuclease/phosphatase family metal-dependent hydrolase n=1 Tax=Eoetvoesiella caeni TaxID=645616 RepID=A0A366HML8_9BURK|nr:endonuclease/exonuclease/phosphatase family protein [Eoetvoesiella caeni]MCI2807390.1 endonuclease/exonuclease/phosphatase family protein [Eoetvoesiella caeni]NYT53215.1 endonuclease/exonuclease/phosphatase family protein [Eoetvoesiella caeni]RBP43195.1 endonuclease/exonuclease/phosphatase family metal-dependent hydrolase [Eoetvoesiella caeni]